jgi:hypothetical protein
MNNSFITNNALIGIVLIILGFIIIYIDQYYRNAIKHIPKEKIIYKYLPRSPQEELEQPVFPSDIFSTMFSQPDPWILDLNDLDLRQKNNMNKYFISAI